MAAVFSCIFEVCKPPHHGQLSSLQHREQFLSRGERQFFPRASGGIRDLLSPHPA